MSWIASTTAHSLQSRLTLLQAREVVRWQLVPTTFHDANASVDQQTT
jgi:hypothetical protein